MSVSSIGDLLPWQEVTIERDPIVGRFDKLTTTVISVGGNSALLANGMCLSGCEGHAEIVSLTGNTNPNCEISDDAQKLLDLVGATAGEKEDGHCLPHTNIPWFTNG